MSDMRIKAENGVLYLDHDNRIDTVRMVETLSKSYLVDAWAYIAGTTPGTPALRVFATSGTRDTGTVLVGNVFGHPDRKDGSEMRTAPITAFHLASGERIETAIGRQRTAAAAQGAPGLGLAQMLIDQAHGRGPQIK